jgi:pantoate--beta-alanine ligase
MSVKIITSADEMLKFSKQCIRDGKSIGFIPTMGALHQGHVSLVERARNENDFSVVSIYVNPTQFGIGEDFKKYPRTLKDDQKLCEAAGVDAIFAPDNLYCEDPRVFVDVGELGDKLCGISRPGHFRGVATVVTKLLNIVRPDRAYFGQKDAQQLRVIQCLVRDLNLGCEIVPCPIVRESDGLAMSSRNQYLSTSERKQALALSHALNHCKQRVAAGERDAMKLMGEMGEILCAQIGIELDYIALVNAHTLDDLKRLNGDVLVAIAAKVGATRLIDNTRFEKIDGVIRV